MTRREWLLGTLAGAASLGLPRVGKAESTISRRALVSRHNPVLSAANVDSPLQVGNGEFAFTADITGLQTFGDDYDGGMPLGTMSQWGWHSFPNPDNYQLEDLMSGFDSHGRMVPYPDSHRSEPFLGRSEPLEAVQKEAAWLYSNPQRIHLGRIGLVLKKKDGSAAVLADIKAAYQQLDLWTGVLESRIELEGQPVRVRTVCHPERDALAIRIESPLLATKRLGVSLAFPYASPGFQQTCDWNSPDRHKTILSREENGAALARVLDDTRYWVSVGWPRNASISSPGAHHFEIFLMRGRELELTIAFSPREISGPLLSFKEVLAAANQNWERFWTEGGAIDFSASSEPRALDLERRIVLSQYLTAVNCAGSLPPQETGLVTNSWCGKFHLEMHWWHAAHFVLWGRESLLERSLPWYRTILPHAQETARRQGYRGARWPKQVGPDGRDVASDIPPFLIWQQPHPIFYSELLYRAKPDRSTLDKYSELVFETAEFMSSFAFWDGSRFVLGPPLIPAQESYAKMKRQVINPTYELAYWHWGLATAQKWRERLGMPRQPEWDKVIAALSRPTVRNGVYATIEIDPFTIFTDHPSMLAALGVLPESQLVDAATMQRTFDDVASRWDWDSTWGWDYPMMAMTAARLGQPAKAIEALMRDTRKNHYLINGHNFQVKGRLPLYLPGNGGLLYTTAMMAAGWDNGPRVHAPGFPNDGRWQVRWEGLRSAI
ncbi:MAG: hypothetical protein ACM3NO_04955 [Deltaproteobacteria bacterium]